MGKAKESSKESKKQPVKTAKEKGCQASQETPDGHDSAGRALSLKYP